MKAEILYLLLLLSVSFTYGQKQIFPSEIGPIDALGSDGTHIYVCSNETITKLETENLSMVQNFSEPGVVRFDYLDCSQPLKLFAFSEDAQQYLLLDQFMNLSGGKRLIDLGVNYSQLVTPAGDGNLWVLDQPTRTIRKIDPMRALEYISVPYERFYRGDASSLILMREVSNRLFLLSREDGILQLDLYGNYLGKVASEKVDWFEVKATQLYYTSDRAINIRNLVDGTSRTIPLSFNPKQFTVAGKKAFLTDGEKLYKINLD